MVRSNNIQKRFCRIFGGNVIFYYICIMKDFINYPLPGENYQHYKGGMYEVICLANHTDNNEVLVIYKSLSFGGTYARPLNEWLDFVEWNRGGRPCKDRRFVKHG